MFLMLASPTDSAGVKATTTLASLVSLATGTPINQCMCLFFVFVFFCLCLFVLSLPVHFNLSSGLWTQYGQLRGLMVKLTVQPVTDKGELKHAQDAYSFSSNS